MTNKTFINNDTTLIFIGDLHGQINKLDALLKQLNFDENIPHSIPDNTKLVFIGDLIDNAPNANTDHVGLLTKVKRLVDNGLAYCLMGNHEFNAIGWATKHSETHQWLRPHNENNTKQHQGFLDDVTQGSEVHLYWVNWFKTLPLYLDFGEIRAIHACWRDTVIKQLKQYINSDSQLNKECWQQAFDKSDPLYDLVETLLKGPEIALPPGANFKDKTGTTRTEIRAKWWLAHAETYRDIAQVQAEVVSDIPGIKLPSEQTPEQLSYPVIVGHYTLSDVPSVLSYKVACVDYNAAKDDNPLVAYCWQGEEDLTETNFVYSNKVSEADLQNTWCGTSQTFKDEDCFYEFVSQGEVSDAMEKINRLKLADKLPESVELLDEKINDILWLHWDPIGVNNMEECRSEYDAFSWEVTLVALFNDVNTVAAELYYLQKFYLDMPSEDVISRSIKIANKIVNAVNEKNLHQGELHGK